MNAIIILLAASTLNWVGVSVTGYKSKYVDSRYFKTEQECLSSKKLNGRTFQRACIPVPELPQEFFDAQEAKDRIEEQNNPNYKKNVYQACITELRNKKLTYKEYFDAAEACKVN